MSTDPDPRVRPARAQAGEDRVVDARGAKGVQIGESNTQIIYNINGGWVATDRVAHRRWSTSQEIDSPYRGLSAFAERDAPFFFGREAAVTQLLDRISELNGTGLLMVSGVSERARLRC